MGGKAFASGPNALFTPRLLPALYFLVLDQTKATLRMLFEHVESPPPAPAKASHGDVDILVCSPLQYPPPSTAKIESVLKAERSISGDGLSFAIPHPNFSDAYVQVDISVQSDVASWRWKIFLHAFGDMWNLLGTTIRPFGLTANDKGLHVRVEEIEVIERKKSMIFLTKDPSAVCELLGLKRERLGIDEAGLVRGGDGTGGRGFCSMEDLYQFVVESRFFRRDTYVKHTLKANDRKRMVQRDGYSAFVDDWLPMYSGIEGGNADLTREKVWKEAVEKFDIQELYEQKIKTWREERERLKLKSEGREQRKRAALEDEVYANAWIETLNNERDTSA